MNIIERKEEFNKSFIQVRDQHGIQYDVEAVFENRSVRENSPYDCVRYITIDNEDIKPSFDLHFHSNNSGRIFKILN